MAPFFFFPFFFYTFFLNFYYYYFFLCLSRSWKKYKRKVSNESRGKQPQKRQCQGCFHSWRDLQAMELSIRICEIYSSHRQRFFETQQKKSKKRKREFYSSFDAIKICRLFLFFLSWVGCFCFFLVVLGSPLPRVSSLSSSFFHEDGY